MDNIAIVLGENIIGWDVVIALCACMASLFISLWVYFIRENRIWPMAVFQVTGIIFALILCRLMYWYCHMELYTDIFMLWTDADMAHFFMFGIVVAAYITALLMKLSGAVGDRHEVLDAASPGMAFSMALFRFGGMFSGACVGKYNISNKIFARLPFAYSSDGRSWKAAAFCISFIWLFAVSGVLIKKSMKGKARVFHLFLILFSLSEIFIDSMRYDASHLFFPGRLLADLNKGAGFMGLSQLMGALVCLYFAIRYYIQTEKITPGKRRPFRATAMLVIFLTGMTIGGVSEYLVQRNSSRWVLIYVFMLTGIVMMGYALLRSYSSPARRD